MLFGLRLLVHGETEGGIVQKHPVWNTATAKSCVGAHVGIVVLSVLIVGYIQGGWARAQNRPDSQSPTSRATSSSESTPVSGKSISQFQPSTFEVASIKRCQEASQKTPPGGTSSSPGRLTVNCATLELLIRQAYVTFADGHGTSSSSIPIKGGPDWIRSDHYSITAKAQGDASRELMNGPMMQKLLEERFNLKVRRETGEIPVYLLTVAKGGIKARQIDDVECEALKRSTEAKKSPPCGDFKMGNKIGADAPTFSIDTVGQTLDFFCTLLSSVAVDRPVINSTGAAGKFTLHLEFQREDRTPKATSEHQAQDTTLLTGGPSVFTALEDQVGLKLVSGKSQGTVLIMDHIDRPTAN